MWALKPTAEMPVVPRHRRRRSVRFAGAVAATVLLAAGVASALAIYDRGPVVADSAAVPFPTRTATAVVAPVLTVSPPAPPARPTRTPAPVATRPTVGGFASMESQVVALTNAQRAQHGCRPLRLDTRLRAAARVHSAEMARLRKLRHDGQDGRDPGLRMADAGYDVRGGWAENIASGYPTAQDVMAAWLDSARHRANILSCDLLAIGVGVARASDGQLYWTQDFGAR